MNENQLPETKLNQVAAAFHQRAKEKGFWDKPRETGTLLMLMVSELSEALEADRKEHYANIPLYERDLRQMNEYDDENKFRKMAFEYNIKDTFEDEIADVFIRLLDLCGKMNIDIDKHIELKMKYNQTRPQKHGKAY